MTVPLDPQTREILTDGLRPDPGFVLDAAVGTTFSVDLDALVLAPLAFALFDSDTDLPDPTALLAALQAYSERIALYCDAAHIAASAGDGRLFVLLEPTLCPVTAPGGGAFHPKVWILRYRSESGDVSHRVLILTRNHTFDRSWDLVVRLDEAEDGTGSPIGGDLAALLRHLNTRRSSSLARSMAESISPLRFACPPGFDAMRFHTLGFGGTDPLASRTADQLLVISPFLSAGRLDGLAANAQRRRLVSRRSELERLGSRALGRYRTPLYLHDEADPDAAPGVRGLHAKVYVLDERDRATWFVGSANATTSAVTRNVEVLLELGGTKAKVGVAVVLREPSTGSVGLRSLLREFEPENAGPLERTPEEIEADRIEQLASALASLRLDVLVAEAGTGFRASLVFRGEAPELAAGDLLRARLVTSTLAHTVDLSSSPCVALEVASAARLTGLVEFELVSSMTGVLPRRFVLLGQLHGAPLDRVDRLLLDLVPDERRFRLLLFLMLASGDPQTEGAELARRLVAGPATHPEGDADDLGIPLFESLARTYARDPERLAAISRLVARFQSTDEGRTRLPAGFSEMWTAFEPSSAGA